MGNSGNDRRIDNIELLSALRLDQVGLATKLSL